MDFADIENSSNVQAETSFEVQLYIYDLSKGLAKSLSSVFLGKQLPGIWHTSIVAYGREYFFGSMGIESCGAGQTILREPDQILTLGHTELPYSLFLEYIFALGESSYKPQTYDLFKHNCNNFTQEVATFLTGKSIPQEILDLPDEFLNTPLGGTLQTYFSSLSLRGETARGLSFGGGAPADFIPFEPSAFRDSRSPESRPHRPAPDRAMSSEMAAETSPQQQDSNPSPERAPRPDGGANGTDEEVEDRPAPVRKSRRYSDPPVFFPDVDGASALKELEELLKDTLNEQDASALRELHEYLVTENGAWALGTAQLDLMAKVFVEGSPQARMALLKVLQAAALKEDVILFLHQDRKSHCIMSYVYRIESLPADEQDEVLKLLCNLCSNVSTYDWLLYISEWSEEGGQSCNNARATVRAAVHGLLCDRPAGQERAAALMFNLALKELFDETSTELSTAILQHLHSDLKEIQAFYCLTALLRFLQISYNDVPALVKMLGPDMQKFSGMSERVTKVVEEIQLKLSVSISA